MSVDFHFQVKLPIQFANVADDMQSNLQLWEFLELSNPKQTKSNYIHIETQRSQIQFYQMN
ncbi:hypothetical protein X975_18893, partial [Stegodyphus mimosarum]